MAARKARVEYYWSAHGTEDLGIVGYNVNWRLVGANGEIMCESSQGFRDKTDAQRSVDSVCRVFGPVGAAWLESSHATVREVGPGRKPA